MFKRISDEVAETLPWDVAYEYVELLMTQRRRGSTWAICDECQGEGHHARGLGEVNLDEWEEEEVERYYAGVYDRSCEDCRGTGKVRRYNGACLGNWTNVESDLSWKCTCIECETKRSRQRRADERLRRAEDGYFNY